MTEKRAKNVEKKCKENSNNDRFPIIVIVIVIAEFCERFSYSGMKAFLTLYLKSKLMYSDDEATEKYHIFTSLIYFFPILGAIVADNYLGKFRTILYMMFVYAAGNAVLAITAIPQLALPGRLFTMIGLLLVSLGAGGIKPCVAAFGGDQFEVPRQEKHLAVYFMVLYFTLCSGSLVAKTVSPLLRSEIHCFGDKDCYSIAFGAPGILMITSIVIFVGAKKFYVMKKPAGNIVIEVLKCISLGIKNKFRKNTSGCGTHWLDSTENEYGRTFITDIKKTLSILTLYIPVPAFWALLDQMGSRWTLQATRMNGDFWFFTLKPDQMQGIAPVIILIIIPLFQKVVYPCFEKFNIMKNPLHKLTVGGILAGVSFIISGCIELHLQTTYPELPQPHLSQMRIFNGYPCPLRINNSLENITATISPYSVYINKHIKVNVRRNISLDIECECREMVKNWFLLEENEALSFYLSDTGIVRYKDNISKSRSGYPLVRFLVDGVSDHSTAILYNEKRQENEVYISDGVSTLYEVFPAKFSILVNNSIVKTHVEMKSGGVYAIIISKARNDSYVSEVIVITEPNTLTMALLLPQFMIISVAEVFFAITGTEFSFKEAPQSMKSVMQASWLLTEAFGNVIIIIVTRLAVNYGQAMQSFIYTGIISVSMVIFYFLAENYEFSTEGTTSSKETTVEPRKNRSNSEVLYMQVKQCEELIDH